MAPSAILHHCADAGLGAGGRRRRRRRWGAACTASSARWSGRSGRSGGTWRRRVAGLPPHGPGTAHHACAAAHTVRASLPPFPNPGLPSRCCTVQRVPWRRVQPGRPAGGMAASPATNPWPCRSHRQPAGAARRRSQLPPRHASRPMLGKAKGASRTAPRLQLRHRQRQQPERSSSRRSSRPRHWARCLLPTFRQRRAGRTGPAASSSQASQQVWVGRRRPARRPPPSASRAAGACSRPVSLLLFGSLPLLVLVLLCCTATDMFACGLSGSSSWPSRQTPRPFSAADAAEQLWTCHGACRRTFHHACRQPAGGSSTLVRRCEECATNR